MAPMGRRTYDSLCRRSSRSSSYKYAVSGYACAVWRSDVDGRTHVRGVVDWEDPRLVTRLGGVAVGSNLGRTLAACGGGGSLCVPPVYGLWCADSFNKPSPSDRQR